MTKNKAYEVLGISSDASTEEIKAAYAELSKKYHPEENPEEFQEIHEAYSCLVRDSRTRRQIKNVDVAHSQMRQQLQTEEKTVYDIEAEKEMSQFDFESAETQGQQEIQERFLVELQQAINKLDDVCLSYDDTTINVYMLQRGMKGLQIDILHNPTYVNKLYTLLQTKKWDDETYKVIVNYMHLWDTELIQNRKDLVVLKQYIEQKKAAYKSANEFELMRIIGVIITAILVGVISLLLNL